MIHAGSFPSGYRLLYRAIEAPEQNNNKDGFESQIAGVIDEPAFPADIGYSLFIVVLRSLCLALLVSAMPPKPLMTAM
jgi:hypothetical protein